MKIIVEGNFSRPVSVVMVLIGVAIMFGFLKYGPPSIISVLMVCFGFGLAIVGGMTSQARLLKIRPFDNSYKKARKIYEVKDDTQDKS
ncbi:hypothetical protein LGN17_04100 [Burkholderia sp. AU30280]|uniref:hypothetical protein n=1 Tax=Burkholderia sp. AU30280 TaxID=2879628 RepID=UPI001CF417D1|nr:hypothetical protein [Burkholderia sp. AU30280]MCA8271703.1 hypothetical protein [Burkholderia sp. AU30280]